MRVIFKEEYLKDSQGRVVLHIHCSRDVGRLLLAEAERHHEDSIDDYLRMQFMRGEGVVDARYQADQYVIMITFRRGVPRWMINTSSFTSLAIRSCGMKVAR